MDDRDGHGSRHFRAKVNCEEEEEGEMSIKAGCVEGKTFRAVAGLVVESTGDTTCRANPILFTTSSLGSTLLATSRDRCSLST